MTPDRRPVNFLPLPRVVLEALINAELVKHLTLQALRLDEQYGFLWSADVLTITGENLSSFNDGETVALNISNRFLSYWHSQVETLYFWANFFFFLNHVIKIVLYGHSSRFVYINTGLLQGSILRHY